MPSMGEVSSINTGFSIELICLSFEAIGKTAPYDQRLHL